ncbi:TPM domain-containing protein [Microbacterium sp. APC 3898]|jgi:uncharacterized protein|uniref:TPM domain-containing protein n=1 Tax=Planococcus notacanthi TaxID=3035188 RepID=A0ABT7ZNN3_9BACL|nr:MULTISPECIES: TPM domain-containing protein [Terrabacteria group]MDN3428780.1 TPM domain-containing protein [Planococcus sp. APC 4016]MDN3500099.1 TPM domain-containing protein [Microbacterium sp. APC 3898]
MKKKIILLSALGIFLVAAPVNAIDFPELTKDIYVQDISGVLSDEAEEELRLLGKNLEDATTAQIAVMAIPSLEGEAIESYALEALRHYEIGSEDENNGVLMVVSTGDREIYIATGYGLEGVLPDAKVGRILDDYAVPYLKKDQFDQGIRNTYTALYHEVTAEYSQNAEAAAPQTGASQVPAYEPREKWPLHRVIIAIVIGIWIVVALFGDGAGRGNGKKSRSGGLRSQSRSSSARKSSGGSRPRRGGGGSGGGGGAKRKF